jgi:hypothetical protein
MSEMARLASWRPAGIDRTVLFFMALSFVNWLGFAGWTAVLNNFTIERVGFGWFETGLTQTIREVPGFLAFTAIVWVAWFREQTIAYVSLLVLGMGIASTGFFPTLTGVIVTTFVMSVGFHYFETINQSLQLQLLPKARAPHLMGRISGAGAVAQFLAYGSVAAAGWMGWQNYGSIYFAIGFLVAALALAAWATFDRFEGAVPQRKTIVVRHRYWLYYALTFMSGARRQIFTAFGAFLLVKKFSYSLADIAMLMLVTAAFSTMLAAQLGRLVGRIGERRTMILENLVLILVFTGYATTSDGRLAGLLFIVDGIFFTLTIAQRTYFQKIADAADMAATASVSFTINHVAAVVIPVTFGLLGMGNPSIIFWLGVVIASLSLILAFLVPRHPAPGRETAIAPLAPEPAR